MAAPPANLELRPLTLVDEVAWLAPGEDLQELCRWPPDAFAFTAAALLDSGAYRCVVNPPAGCVWPPDGTEPHNWANAVRRDAAAWAANAAEGLPPPPPVLALQRALSGADVPLRELDHVERWGTLATVLWLHAVADEACAGAGILSDTPFQRLAAERLAASGSLSRLSRDRVRVMPKMRPPASGITLRSLSHHVALDRSEVETRWLMAPPTNRSSGRLNLLLVPQPFVIRASDFVPVRGPLANMDESRYGFFEYSPHESLDPEDAVRLVERARKHVGDIDGVVLPEGALDVAEVEPLQRRLAEAGVPYLIAGVRKPASDGTFSANYAYFGARDWQAPAQHKHHRWAVDANQVHQYHLGAALDPRRNWWEAIGVPRRCLTFVTLSEQLTICPLVCEDLARPDPVTDVVRSVAPTLVVALLLDGPQLATRWPARYASVLADDPGCSVLTLTSLGMALRCQPPGYGPSRAIALWKDPHRGLLQLTLKEGARALALTAHARTVEVPSADGRTGKQVAELVLSGVEDID